MSRNCVRFPHLSADVFLSNRRGKIVLLPTATAHVQLSSWLLEGVEHECVGRDAKASQEHDENQAIVYLWRK